MHAADCDRASTDPPYPFAIMGPRHQTQQDTITAMGAQPLILACPICEKTDRSSMDQAVGPVSLCPLLREFFLVLLANRLYLPHSLG